jgi:hypothetical protein
MTVRELCERMDSRELSEWMAYTRYFVALPDPWLQTGLLASIATAPYTDPKRGKPPTATDFVPTLQAPQHEEQDRAAIERLRRELGIVD